MNTKTLFKSPIGNILLSADARGLTALRFVRSLSGETAQTRMLKEGRAQLEAYFQGKLTDFDLPLVLEGTPFQKAVWKVLQEIPFGETRTYKEVAELIGRPLACRAVGNAVGKNPLPIVVPCHRVVAGNGKMGGFSCGIEKKHYLLHHESQRFFSSSKTTGARLQPSSSSFGI